MSNIFELVDTPRAPQRGFMGVTLVGSGVSTAVPVIGHISCNCACADAIEHPLGHNCRNNVSLLITIPDEESKSSLAAAAAARATSTSTEKKGTAGSIGYAHFTASHNTLDGVPVRCVLIDCGKTFRDAYFRVLVKHKVQTVDALLLTHGHADAIAGLDDLRDLQRMHMRDADWIIDSYVPTFLTEETLTTLRRSAGYIVDNSHCIGAVSSTAQQHQERVGAAVASAKAEKGIEDWNNIGIRRSTALQLFMLPEDKVTKFHVPPLGDIPLYAVPVEHGKDYISLGFVFGRGTAFKSMGGVVDQVAGKSCVVYLSDISTMPDASLAFLQDLVKIDILFIDMLHKSGRTSPVHYCVDDVMALIVRIKPKYVFGIGMYCDMKHDESRAELAAMLAQKVANGELEEGEVNALDLGFDGMDIMLPQ